MSTKTGIEWTDATWNPIRGCSRVSEGCRHCYAERVAYRFSGAGQPYAGLATKINGHAAWTGRVEFAEKRLLDPLKWKQPRRIFVNSMSDLFHENVPDEWIDRIFAVMALCPQHQFQVLTKRPERMLKYFANLQTSNRVGREINVIYGSPKLINTEIDHPGWSFTRDGNEWEPLPNVWLGVSDEGNRHERVDILRQVPAAVRFVSAEPLIFNPGKVDLSGIDWVIVGGESGPGARPMHPDWVRSLRDQCQAAGTPFFFKQWGEWTSHLPPDHGVPDGSVGEERCIWMNGDGRTAPLGNSGGLKLGPDNLLVRVGKHAAGAYLDGREWREFPGGGRD